MTIMCVKCCCMPTDTETLAVNHTLELDVYSGINILTIYITLLIYDPLLLASINFFEVELIQTRQSISVVPIDNKVIYLTI